MRQALLASTGEAPDISAIYMWTQRDRIAGPWLAECVCAALKAKPFVTVWDLMCEAKPPDPDERRSTLSPFPPYTGEMDLDC